ncbi:DUF3042 family protein [Lactococcus taiwanensis]|uniref:DUF3042 family protein n=1 Tax=Lactococcus taiwanensis TaxID=1151742 RepID=UPI003518D298
MDKKTFIAGVLTGKATTYLALGVHYKVINPLKNKALKVDSGRKRAARKRIAP